MKKEVALQRGFEFTICLIAFLLPSFYLEANCQNIVPNGSFEQGLECPSYVANLNNQCSNWYSSIVPADELQPTPDWFHTCSDFDQLSPPSVVFGTQELADGEGYAGIVVYNGNSSIDNYREIIGVELNQPLVEGETYLVEFYVSSLISNISAIASNNLGFNFTVDQYYHRSNFPINSSAFSIDTILTLSDEWTQISETFIADSAYNFLHIGNFYDDDNTEIIAESDVGYLGYYVIDAVTVSQIVSTGIDGNKKSHVNLYPNPAYGTVRADFADILFVKKVDFFSSTGKLQMTQIIQRSLDSINLNLNSLNPGVYLMSIETLTGIYHEKIIKI